MDNCICVESAVHYEAYWNLAQLCSGLYPYNCRTTCTFCTSAAIVFDYMYLEVKTRLMLLYWSLFPLLSLVFKTKVELCFPTCWCITTYQKSQKMALPESRKKRCHSNHTTFSFKIGFSFIFSPIMILLSRNLRVIIHSTQHIISDASLICSTYYVTMATVFSINFNEFHYSIIWRIPRLYIFQTNIIVTALNHRPQPW
jgi:hypothetical protein